MRPAPLSTRSFKSSFPSSASTKSPPWGLRESARRRLTETGLKPASLLQHEMLADVRVGSKPAIRHHPGAGPQYLSKQTSKG